MSRETASVVVLDLDNTLWDWLEVWHASFSAFLDAVLEQSKTPRDALLSEIRAVHQKHGTSEYVFLLEEIPSLRKLHPDAQLHEVYRAALEAAEVARRNALRLYPTVYQTLWTLKESGCLLVGYTESMAAYSNYRLRNTGLDGLMDYVYYPADHAVPKDLTPEQIRRYPAEEHRLQKTLPRTTPAGELKPNAHILKSILSDVGAYAGGTVYVGDSLMKDIAMAQEAGVTDVYAQYGDRRNSDAYELLKLVTHWTAADVQREQEIGAKKMVTPTYVLDHCLCQLLTYFTFVPFKRGYLP